MKKTKIICTVGPATDAPEVLEELMRNGMNVARLNFSHGEYAEHQSRIDQIKALRERLQIPIAILLDTKGPEIRIRDFEAGKVELVEGQEFTLTTDDVMGNSSHVSVSVKTLHEELKPGMRVLISDGLIELIVKSVEGHDILCTVMNDGELGNRKSINIPNVHINMPYVSKKDRDDLLFGIKNDIDFVAASFMRSKHDALKIREILDDNGGKDIHIIAKIENSKGIENVDEILKVCDGLMIARGDMGVEVPIEDLPSIQKKLIKKCFSAGKISITATQMLDSMIRNPRPTRAEATDVANAIYDGTSAIMLSGETAIGDYPVEALEMMVRIAEKTEDNIHYRTRFHASTVKMENTITNAIGHATCMTAFDLDVTAILTVSSSGHTARTISKFRPDKPIVCATLIEKTRLQLALSWGVYPIKSELKNTTDELFRHAVNRALEEGFVVCGDIVAITAGAPMGVSGTTNILKVHIVGE
ncbi:MAG: pyruvate kinase [Clostridia bacterium]